MVGWRAMRGRLRIDRCCSVANVANVGGDVNLASSKLQLKRKGHRSRLFINRTGGSKDGVPPDDEPVSLFPCLPVNPEVSSPQSDPRHTHPRVRAGHGSTDNLGKWLRSSPERLVESWKNARIGSQTPPG